MHSFSKLRCGLCCLAALFAIAASAQYRPIDAPREWTFTEATPAFALDEPTKPMGDFQPGISVRVLETDTETGHWRVAFQRYGARDIISLIDPPNLAKARPDQFARIAPLLAQFPLLETLLESEKPWPDSAMEMAGQLLGDRENFVLQSGPAARPAVLAAVDPGKTAPVWGFEPVAAQVDYSRTESPKIVLELWSKGDAFQSSVDPGRANAEIEKNLAAIQQVFRTTRKDPGADSAANAITAVRIKEDVFLLPNDLRVSLRYDSGEYLLLVIESISKLEARQPLVYDPGTFKETLAARVKHAPGGHLYISEIPMIDQGEKGYCAAATLARVLQHYGYAADVHALADLAQTEAQLTESDRGGTLRRNIIQAMRRICNSTPFTLTEIKEEHPDAIREVLEQGIPIIWFVPGHACLLIGLHPETNEIVFSDSWGAEFQYRIASWNEFVNANMEMWTLVPR